MPSPDFPWPEATPWRCPRATPVALRTVAELRAIEHAALAEGDPMRLMRRAGASLARLALAIAPHAAAVRVHCGPGHNGGDGMLAAAALAATGRRVELLPAFEPERLAGLPQAVRSAWAEAVSAGCRVVDADAPPPLSARALVVDALLGIGARGQPRGRILAALRRIAGHGGPVLAVDVPSGLDADTGAVAGDAVRATHTLSFLAAKPGLFTGLGRDHAGQVWVDDLGLAAAGADGGAAQVLGGLESPALPARHADHKGTRGDVLVLGGAAGMDGATELAARAAHAAGAGRVWRVLLEPGPPSGRPELMQLALDAALEPARLGAMTVVAGCGGGRAVAARLGGLIAHAARLVLDADALNALAADPVQQGRLLRRHASGRPTVLTPHPLEAARLLDCSTRAVQDDRFATARALAGRFGAVVVLKGSGTLVARPDGPVLVNPNGGPALATAGTGDVLAGWIGGLWARIPEPETPDHRWLDAARAAQEACRLHGAVGGAVERGPLRAADLLERMWAASVSAPG